MVLVLPTLAQSSVTYQYIYDSAGRLTEAIDSSGNEIIYTYDAAGNLTGIQHLIGVQVGITGASTQSGVAGQQVTFTGFGFGGGACVQSVTFNGVAATVVSSTDTSVTVIIPTGATSGPVQITTCNGTATSTFNFLIGAVIVTPPAAYLDPGASVQFTASVLPDGSSQAVTWSVDGAVGGDAAVGTITTDGFYTAPGTAAGTVLVRATSVANPALYGEASVTILDPVNLEEAFSPGVSVLINTANVGSMTPLYVLSPGVSVWQNTTNLGAAVPVYVVSPGVSVFSGSLAGTAVTTPFYVVSPGVSVLTNTTNAGGAAPVYVLSLGVSVRLGLASNGTGQSAVYVLSPPVSVQMGTAARAAMPVTIISPGVSVINLMPTSGRDEGAVFILSPGVSVMPARQTGQGPAAMPFSRGPTVAEVAPSGLRWGPALVTVTGTDLNEARAVGFLDDGGHLDKNITVRGATVSPGGRAMTLRLSVGPWAVPGRRRLVLWSLPRLPLVPAVRQSGRSHTP